MSRQRFASNTCSQAVRAVPLRWLYDRPLRITAAACGDRPCASGRCRAPCRRGGVRPSARREATPRTASTRCGGATSRWPLAAAASVAIMPAMPRALARAWPWPQPSATVSTTAPPRHFSQSSSLRRRASAPAAQRRTMPASSAIGFIRCIDAPALPASGSLISRPKATGVVSALGRSERRRRRRARQPDSRSRLPQSLRAIGAAGVPAERRGRGLHLPRPAAVGVRLLAAEHAVEEARRVGAHQLAAQAVARRHAVALHRRLLGGEPAGADLGIGEEGRRHDRLDGRGRHRVVEHRRVEQRIGPVLHRIRQARIAGLVAAGPVDLLAGAGRERAGERLDPAAGDVDHRHRRHPHHRAFEQRLAERLRLVGLAMQAEGAAGRLAAGVAGGGLLRQRLQRRVDGEVDREADVDAAAVEDDPVRPPRAGRRRRPTPAAAGRLQAIERAGRLAQRLERLQHRLQRRRHAPAAVVERIGEAGLAGEHGRRPDAASPPDAGALAAGVGARQLGQRADPPLGAARRREEGVRAALRRRLAAEIDAAADAAPGIAAHHLARRDQHLLRRRASAASASRLSLPRQARLSSIARVAARQRGERVGEIGAAQAEADAPARRDSRSASPAPRAAAANQRPASKPTGCSTRAIAAAAEGEQRGVEAGELRRDLLGRRRRRRARQAVLGQPGAPGRGAAPFALALGQRREHAGAVGNAGADRAAPQHRRLEGLQRRDQAHAQVALLRAAAGRIGIGRADHRDQQDDAEQHRHDRDARGDREVEQRGGLALSHRAPLPAGRGGRPAPGRRG